MQNMQRRTHQPAEEFRTEQVQEAISDYFCIAQHHFSTGDYLDLAVIARTHISVVLSRARQSEMWDLPQTFISFHQCYLPWSSTGFKALIWASIPPSGSSHLVPISSSSKHCPAVSPSTQPMPKLGSKHAVLLKTLSFKLKISPKLSAGNYFWPYSIPCSIHLFILRKALESAASSQMATYRSCEKKKKGSFFFFSLGIGLWMLNLATFQVR